MQVICHYAVIDPEYEYELQSRHQEQSSEQRDVSRRQGPGVMAPMMRALIELEETRATQSRAPCKNIRFLLMNIIFHVYKCNYPQINKNLVHSFV